MDLSGLIFVALAVAWAAYLIPKALQHHEDVVRSRSVDRFSHRMRVLARREPVNRRNARLVVTPGRARGQVGGDHELRSSRRAPPPRAATNRGRPSPSPRTLVLLLAQRRRRRRGRRRSSSPGGVAAPAALLVAWLVACRLMVSGERTCAAVGRRAGRGRADRGDRRAARRGPRRGRHRPFAAVEADPDLWDPVPVTLPTYVGKAAAQPHRPHHRPRRHRRLDVGPHPGRQQARPRRRADRPRQEAGGRGAGSPRPRGRVLTGSLTGIA